MSPKKFRYWYDLDDEDIPGKMIYSGDDALPWFFASFAHDGNEDIMQWTGLKDHKGVDIYEGDIVTVTKDNEGITANKEMYPKNIEVSYSGAGFSPWYIDAPHIIECEVIGNIYENPDLIK